MPGIVARSFALSMDPSSSPSSAGQEPVPKTFKGKTLEAPSQVTVSKPPQPTVQLTVDDEKG